ncbi:MAG TPA: hypothetical protein VGV40_02435 [Solirubrobacteraceae bacterium]|nr:hypothetical protein [Solirubrobacteraceae bacterium]
MLVWPWRDTVPSLSDLKPRRRPVSGARPSTGLSGLLHRCHRSEAVPLSGRPGARPRAAERLDDGLRDRLRRARRAQGYEDPKTAIALSYYSTFEAARAALSEEDRFARTHRGTWHLPRELLVATGRLDAGVVEEADPLHNERIAVDYGTGPRPMGDGAKAIATAECFLAAVERLLDAPPPQSS